MKDKKYEFKIKIDKAWNTWNITLFHERDNRVLFSDTIEFDNLMIYIKQLMRSICGFYVEISSDNTELIKALREINTLMVVLYEQPEEVHQSCNDDAEYESFKREYLSKKIKQ